MAEQLIDMSVVRIDGDTQPRTAMNPVIVHEYAEAMQTGVEFPAVTVVHDGATYWLVDGFHRFFAHRRLSRQQIKAEVIAGELKDARWLSVAANKAHGLRRTNADKAKAVVRALKLRPELSDRAIAEHVGVDHKMIGRYREILTRQQTQVGKCPTSDCTAHRARVGRDGKHYPTGAGNRRLVKPAIGRNAHQPAGAGGRRPRAPENPLPAMTAMNVRDDPEMGALVLTKLFGRDYLRALVSCLSRYLEEGSLPAT